MTNIFDVIAKTGQNPPPAESSKGSLKPGDQQGAGPITVHTGGQIQLTYPSEYVPGKDREIRT